MTADRSAIRVLVVDDTDHVRSMLIDMLTLDGFNVVGEAASGPEAVERAADADPDVIVMDYRMPEADGIAAARTLRALRPTQVVILYTAYLTPELEDEAREAGIALCVGKIEGLVTLERAIRELHLAGGPRSRVFR